KEEQETLRQRHFGQADAKPLLTIEQARQCRTPIDWKTSDIPTPSFTGIRVLDDFALDELIKFIDWSPFFHAWELRGRYPAILEDSKARELFDDAQRLLSEIAKNKLI